LGKGCHSFVAQMLFVIVFTLVLNFLFPHEETDAIRDEH
jgi:uncharacterized membrane protein YjfL (UPF0719 family)